LFPGQNPINPMSTRQLNRICHMAAAAAEIDKRVSMHTLRHNAEFRIIPSWMLGCV
jgi:site-specific recombinase XerD